jgi:hypothetical protein
MKYYWVTGYAGEDKGKHIGFSELVKDSDLQKRIEAILQIVDTVSIKRD